MLIKNSFHRVSVHICLAMLGCLTLLAATGCGYSFGEGGAACSYRTISVPFIQGDWNGELTAAVIHEIAQTGCFEYKKDGGALELKIRIIDFRDVNIGFRYDRKRTGELRKSIIPTESRLGVTVEVALINTATCETVLGPVKINSNVDFDHDYYKSLHAINIFSLGQLSDYDAAYDAAYRPLNRNLAKKISDFICDSW